MPEVQLENVIVKCKTGDNLRRILLRAKAPLYNGVARTIHCRGMGTCGTCAVAIEGEVSPPTAIEKWRLSFPPHHPHHNLRLACQCQVLGDLKLTKHPGMWGHKVEKSSE